MYGELMSRIGKKPVVIPAQVKVECKGQHIKLAGPLGELEMDCHPLVKPSVKDNMILVENDRPNDKAAKALHGTMRALIANMVYGVTNGYEKKMRVHGTGYNVKEVGGKIVLQAGFCHTVEHEIPKGIKVTITVPNAKGDDVPAEFIVKGTDKIVVGQFTANLRRTKPPEPYKGKGVRYADEHVRRKAGKAFTSGSA